eukprot:gene13259-14623_t
MADSDGEQEETMLCTIAACAGVLHWYEKCGVKKRKRNVWAKVFFLRREERGAYNMIMQELRLKDAESFRKQVLTYILQDKCTFGGCLFPRFAQSSEN